MGIDLMVTYSPTVQQVWLISCTLFVFLALMEYFIVLFGIRYDKHWRTTAGIANKPLVTGLRPSPSPIRLRAADSSIQINNDAPVSNGKLGI